MDPLKTLMDTIKNWWLFALGSVAVMLVVAKFVFPFLFKDGLSVTLASAVNVPVSVTNPVITNPAGVQKVVATFGGPLLGGVTIPFSNYVYAAIGGTIAIILAAVLFKTLVQMRMNLGKNPTQKLAVVYVMAAFIGSVLVSIAAGGFGNALNGLINWPIWGGFAIYGVLLSLVITNFGHKVGLQVPSLN